MVSSIPGCRYLCSAVLGDLDVRSIKISTVHDGSCAVVTASLLHRLTNAVVPNRFENMVSLLTKWQSVAPFILNFISFFRVVLYFTD